MTQASSTPATPRREAIRASLLRVIGPWMRHRRLVFGVPVVLMLLTVVVVLILPATYSVDGGFVPQTSSSTASALVGVAAQFGVNLGDQDPTQSADFYSQLLTSTEFRRAMAAAPVEVGEGGARRTIVLADYYDIDKSLSPEARLIATAAKMREDFDVWTNPRIQWVQFEYRSSDPGLSYAIALRTLAWVDSFNIAARRSAAAEQVTFIEGRVRDATDSLTQAENAMQYFLERNREYRSSPQLTFQAARLQQRIDLFTGVLTSLRTNLESSRVDAVRNTSVVTVVLPVRYPPSPDPRRTILKAVLVAILGFIVLASGTLLESEFGISWEWVRELFGTLRRA